MIIRTEKNRNNPYYMKNRAATEDPRLSWKAKGVHDYLMSKPDNWEANINQLVKASPDGAAAVRSAVKELIKYGYIARVQVRESGKIAGWRLDTFESPALNPFHKNGKTSLAIDDGGGDELDIEIRDLDDEQDGDFQHVENLDVENRTHNKYSSVVSIDLERIAPPAKQKPAKPQSPPPQPLLAEPVGDPYMDAAVNKFNRQQQGRAAHPGQIPMDDWNKRVPAAQRLPLLKVIAKLTGKTPMYESDDVKIANLLHEAAIKAHKWGYTPDDLKDLERPWLADWRSGGKLAGRIDQFEEFLSEQVSNRNNPSPTKSNSTAGSYVPVDVMAELERITLEQQRIGSH